MRILMSGGSGLIGTALSRSLAADGHTVSNLVRRQARAHEVTWDPAAGQLPPEAFDGCDAVINLSGAGIGDKRWTDDYKRELLASRVQTTELLATTMAELDDPPSVFLSGSAVGWYGDRGDERLDEISTPGDGFLSDLCQQWEDATIAAEKAGIRTVHLRTGIVLSSEGGILKKQLPLFKARSRRPLRQRPSMAELDIHRRRGRGDHSPPRVRDLRCGQPHGAGACDQRRVHHDAGQGRAPPGSDPDPRLRAEVDARRRARRLPVARWSTSCCRRLSSAVATSSITPRWARRCTTCCSAGRSVTGRRCRPPPTAPVRRRGRGARWSAPTASSPSAPPTSPRTRCRRDRRRTGSC